MRRAWILWVASVVAGCGVLAGCGVHAGPAVMVPISGAPVAYGVGSGWSFYPDGSEGIAIGARGRMGYVDNKGWMIRAWGGPTVGYGARPIPSLSRWGLELNAGPAFGALRDSGSYAGAIGWTMDLDLLYRFTATKRPWENSSHLSFFHMVVPSIQFAQLIPIGSSHSHAPDTTFVFSLSHRFDSWFAVEP